MSWFFLRVWVQLPIFVLLTRFVAAIEASRVARPGIRGECSMGVCRVEERIVAQHVCAHIVSPLKGLGAQVDEVRVR